MTAESIPAIIKVSKGDDTMSNIEDYKKFKPKDKDAYGQHYIQFLHEKKGRAEASVFGWKGYLGLGIVFAVLFVTFILLLKGMVI